MKQFYFSFYLFLFTAFALHPALVMAQCPVAAACTPGRASNPQAAAFGMGIFRVRLGSIDTTTAGNTDGYQNYSCTQRTQLAPGLSYPITITTNANVDENVRVWVDYNNDGVFDPVTELTFSSNNARLHAGITAVIPSTAVLGVRLRLRVAADASTAPIPTPCSTPQYSQTEDYSVILVANTQPPIPAFTVGAASACAGTFTFTDQSQRGPTSWRWSFGDGTSSTQQSPSHTYTQAGAYAVTLRVCNSFGCDSLTQTAAANFYTSNPVAATCSPQTLSYCCGYGVTAVALNGTTYTSADARAGYEDFSCTRRFTVTQNDAVPLRLQTGTNPQNLWVYVDLNNDGTFATSELVWQAVSASNPETFFVVPNGALLNQPLRLRVVADAAPGPATPCAAPASGQVEDYSLMVTPTTCQPQAAYPLLVNSLFSDNNGLSGTLQGFVLDGLRPHQRVQWQRSPVGTPVWQDIAGATAPVYAETFTTANYRFQFRAQVRCGTTTTASSALPANYNAAGPLHSPCDPTHAYIQRVRLAGTWLDNSSVCDATHHNSYRMYSPLVPSQTALVQHGQRYRLEVTTSQAARVSVFAEYYSGDTRTAVAAYPVLQARTTAAGVPAVLYVQLDSTINRRTDALRLRVRCDQETTIADAAITASYYLPNGETEDYFLRETTPACADPVSAGALMGWQTARCPADGLAVQALAPTPGARLQWQTSPDSLNWTNVTGQTGFAYTGTVTSSQYLRLWVQGCTTTAYSAAKLLTVRPLAQCYCTAGGAATTAALPLLTRVRIAGTPLDNSSPAAPGGPAVVQYAPTAASRTATLVRGATYGFDLTVQPGAAGTTTHASAWLDANGNGRYDSLEWAPLLRVPTPTAATTYRTEFRVPLTARPGQAGLRLRVGTAPLRPGSTCAALPGAGGETEEYLVTLMDAPCGPAPLTAGVLDSLGGTDCPYAVRARLYSPGAMVQWQRSTNGGAAWTDLPGATEDTYLLPAESTRPTEVRYRMQARCGTAVAVTRALVLPAAFNACGNCTPPTNHNSRGCALNYVDDVSLSGTTLANFGSGCNRVSRTNASGATYQYAVVQWSPQVPAYTGTVVRGSTYSLRMRSVAPADYASVGAWIDWNRDGTFAASEFYGLAPGGTLPVNETTVTVPVAVPIGAATGLTPMKIFSVNSPILASYGCLDPSDSEVEFYYLSVVAQPAPMLPTLAAAPQPLCVGTTLQLQATSAGTGAVYAWLGPASFAASSANPTIPNVTAANDGTYVAVADLNGQRMVTSVYVPVSVCLATRPAGAAGQLTIYPNPTTGFCTLRLPAQVTAQVIRAVVRNATGQVVGEYFLQGHTNSTASTETALDLRGKTTGLYFVEVQTEQGRLFSKIAIE